MAKPRTIYVCGACGASTPQWQGQCPACEAWNTLEIAVSSIAPAGASRNARTVTAGPSTSRTVTDIAQESDVRAVTGIGELDRVLGGGLVAGSVVLLVGDPGIGKSTLLLQAADALSRERPVLQRYMPHFPAAGEIIIWDRSWYNRAGVEHVMGFCSKDLYERFLELCPIS